MESRDEFGRKLAEMKCQLERQKTVVEELGQVVASHAQSVIRYDHTVILETLKARIMQEVNNAHAREDLASNEFNNGQIIGGSVGFLASIIFTPKDSRIDPLERGANAFFSAINKKVPFHTVLVAIGKNGLPDDVTVVSISALARNSHKFELEIMGNFAKDGYLLLDSRQFTGLINNLKSKVLDGSALLPLNVEKVTSYLPAITRKIKPPE
jgi:uncharacterized coiled-coil protein SlyX